MSHSKKMNQLVTMMNWLNQAIKPSTSEIISTPAKTQQSGSSIRLFTNQFFSQYNPRALKQKGSTELVATDPVIFSNDIKRGIKRRRHFLSLDEASTLSRLEQELNAFNKHRQNQTYTFSKQFTYDLVGLKQQAQDNLQDKERAQQLASSIQSIMCEHGNAIQFANPIYTTGYVEKIANTIETKAHRAEVESNTAPTPTNRC